LRQTHRADAVHSQLPAALGQYTDMGLSLSLISSRVRAGDYYKCKEALQADLHRMVRARPPPSL